MVYATNDLTVKNGVNKIIVFILLPSFILLAAHVSLHQVDGVVGLDPIIAQLSTIGLQGSPSEDLKKVFKKIRKTMCIYLNLFAFFVFLY